MFFNDTATSEIYTLSLHDALPISSWCRKGSPSSARRRRWSGCREGRLKSEREAWATDAPTTVHRPANPNPKDRKSTRLNSSHANISYAVFCLKKTKHQSLQYIVCL